MKMQERLLQREQTGLVVIDLQEKLLPHIHDWERVLHRAVRTVKAAKILGIPIILTEQEKLGETVEPLRQELQGIEPIRKISFSCFGCEEFDRKLKEAKFKNIVLLGIEAHICVFQTALEALSSYNVYVVFDASSSRHPHDRDVAMRRMEGAGVKLTTFEMLVYELLQKAGTDEFRAILSLVK